MRKQVIFRNLIMIAALAFSVSCSNDDGCTTKTFYLDEDEDGYGVSSNTQIACTAPAGYVLKSGDTNDENDQVFPGCTEITYYKDNDGDDYGDSSSSVSNCGEAPDGYVDVAGDPNDNNSDIFPGCTEGTFFLDEDGDGYGDPNKPISACAVDPENGITGDNTDCNDEDPAINPGAKTTFYLDSDGDNYGDASQPVELAYCPTPIGYVLNNIDCDDDDGNAYPGGNEIPGDAKDTNCDGSQGTIWNGPEITFSKTANANWTEDANQDQLTLNVSFTRQNGGPMYNYEWWQDTFDEDAEHADDQNSDLLADFDGDSNLAIKNLDDITLTGGTKRVRWTILDDTGASATEAWSAFDLYGTLNDPTNYYSFHNIATIIYNLEDNVDIVMVQDDFYVWTGGLSDEVDFSLLVGKKLGVWLVEDDIYLTLTFTDWEADVDGVSGGAFSYTRSTPPVEN